MFKLFIIFIMCCNNSVFCIDEETFNEELVLSDLGNGYSYFGFNFIFSRQIENFDFHASAPGRKHFTLFPRSISDLVGRFWVSEFHLTLSQGYWDHATWGYPSQPQPQGAELWAWLHTSGKSQQPTRTDKNWQEFVLALSGMFCASISSMATGAIATSPVWSYRPEGLSQKSREQRILKVAQIMNHGVCTENLTPWARLLPCKKQAGLGQLLNAVRLHDSAYNSVQVHLRPTHRGLTLRLAMTAVIDRRIAQLGKADWSIHSLLGRAVSVPCSLAAADGGSRVLVALRGQPGSDPAVEPLSSGRQINLGQGGGSNKLVEFDLPAALEAARDAFNVKFSFPWTWVPVEKMPAPPVTVHKYQVGTGSENGGVMVAVSNRHPSQAITLAYLDIVPWQFRVLFHTLELKLGDLPHKALKIHYQQSVDRERPAKLELLISVPPRATLRVSYAFAKQLLRWNEFPPDANHGLYLPPTVISFNLPGGGDDKEPGLRLPVLTQQAESVGELTRTLSGGGNDTVFVRLYTEALLVNSPKPDFSMPYNVLCLVCTVLAIGSGFMHNAACKLASVANPNSAVGGMKSRLLLRLLPWRRASGVEAAGVVN